MGTRRQPRAALRSLSCFICASIIVGLVLGPTCIQARPAGELDRDVDFNIRAQMLDSALQEWGAQAHVQIMLASSAITDRHAGQIKGRLSARLALGELLSGSGLSYHEVGGHTVTIESAAAEGAVRSSFRVAEATTPQSSASDAAADTSEGPKSDRLSQQDNRKPSVLEEIVVTGTHIRGVENPTIPMLTFDRDMIDATGYSSTEQLMRNIPQNFSGGDLGASEDGHVGPGSKAATNVSNGTGVNLRGLGNTSTLVLINGHRVAPSAYGAFVDISLIPLEAIERVEVLTDGASATYGSDAVAGVVNFVLRKDFQGAESKVRFGSVTDGATREEVASQILGTSWDRGGAMLSMEYRDRGDLPSSNRSFSANAPQPTDLLPNLRQYSALLNAHESVTSEVDLYVDGLFTQKYSHLLYAPAIGSTQESSPSTRQPSVNVGVSYAPFGDWRIDLSGGYSSEHTSVDQAVNPPTPPFVNGTTFQTDDFTLHTVDIKADGTLASLPGGLLKGAVGGAYRTEDFSSGIPFLALERNFHRSVKAAFAEVYAPVVGESNKMPLIDRLDISAAIRHDRYSDFGGTTNPRIGLVWTPFRGVDVHSSYSKSFRAPNASELTLISVNGLQLYNAQFAAPGGGSVPTLIVSGSNASLQPEKSTNLTLGVTVKPPELAGFSVGIDYYRINFKDRIIIPPYDVGALLHPAVYGSLITSLPTDAAAQAFLDTELAQGGQFYDLLGTGITGVRYVYNDSEQNAARVDQSGFDVTAGQTFSVGGNHFRLGLDAAFIQDIRTSFTATSLATDLVNTYANPLRRRLRADAGWARGAIQLDAAVNYSGGYTDTSVAPYGHTASWTTVDMNLRYTVPAVRGLTIGASVQNLTNANPPYVVGAGVSGVHYDTGNASPLGRFVGVNVMKSWQ